MKLIIDGVEIEVLKKDIKNIYLRVKPPLGKVVISAPYRVKKAEIEEIVHVRMDWIKEMQENLRKSPQTQEKKYVSGEILYVWGKKYILQVEYGNRKNSMILSGNQAILTVRKESTAEQREKFVREWYRSLLKMEIESVLPVWEKKTGLYCSGWQTKMMKSRWGTCNTRTKKIWINLQLAQKSPECLEYVILHELAHLKERGHGPEFKAILDQYMPEWREVRKRMNQVI